MPESTYTPEKTEAVLSGMRDGLSLRKACEAAGVNKSTFLLWVDGDKALADQYARAREAMLDAQAEELDEIGDDAAKAETAVEVAGLRLKSDNRKWLLSKLAAKKYGDKVETVLSGDVTLTTQTKEQRDAAVAAALRADS